MQMKTMWGDGIQDPGGGFVQVGAGDGESKDEDRQAKDVIKLY